MDFKYGLRKKRADVHLSGHKQQQDATIDVTTVVHDAVRNIPISMVSAATLLSKKQLSKHVKYAPAVEQAKRKFYGPVQNDKGRMSQDAAKLWNYGVTNFNENSVKDLWHLDRKVYNRHRRVDVYEKGWWSLRGIGLFHAMSFAVQTAIARQEIVEDCLRCASRKTLSVVVFGIVSALIH